MSANNIEINFVSDEMPSFYIYLLNKGFFSELPVSKNVDFFKNLKSLQENLNQNQIKTPEELKCFIENRFLNQMPQTEKSIYLSEFQTQFQMYNQFYAKHKEKTNAYVQALEKTQKFYTDRLKKLYHFLGIKEDFKCYGIVTPVPFKSIDGAASSSGFYILFSPDKKKDEVYVDHSLLPERKQYTPLHEAGHVLYSISPSRRNFSEQKGLGARKLILTLSQYFYEHPEERKDKNMTPAWNALQCVDEAVAVFAASVSTDKVGYYGWEAADMLCKHFYPIANRYLQENKPLDDKLYAELAVSLERHIYQKNVQKLISHSQAER